MLSRLLCALLFLGASSLYAQNIVLVAINPAAAPAGSAMAMTATGFTVGVPVAPGTVTFTPRAGGPAIDVTGSVQGLGLGRTINFIVPPGPSGLYDVTFARPGVVSTNSLPFTLDAPASFTVSPDTGSQGALVFVTITLSNATFGPGATASFGPGIQVGSGAAGGFGEVLPTTVPFQANAWLTIQPGATPGPRTVQVNSSNGLLSLANAFTVTAPPVNLLVTPNNAQQGQSLSVTLAVGGASFTPASTVNFGSGVTVQSVVFNSPASLTANITVDPQAIVGFRDVVVTTAGAPVTGSNAFSVTPAPPRIVAVTPTAARQGQTASVTITGFNTNFVQGLTQINLGPGIVANVIAVQSPTSLTATFAIDPSAAVGPRDVAIATPSGLVTGAGMFTVNPALPQQILSVQPPTGQRGSNLSVIVLGQNTNFDGTSAVSFGPQVTVQSISVANPEMLTANLSIASDAGVGPRDVVVTTGGVPLTGAGLFSVTAPPARIVSVTPGTAEQGTSAVVTIVGENVNFTGASSVSFGDGVVVTSVIPGANPNTLLAALNIAAGAAIGPRDVTVTTNGVPVTGAGMFLVLGTTPRITAVSPGTANQGQTLPIQVIGQGTNFNAGSTISLGPGVAVSNVVRQSPTLLLAQVAIDSTAVVGLRDVTVITDGVPLTGSGMFAISDPPPQQILSVTPPQGRQGETITTQVKGEGTHFNNQSVANFGPGITVNSVAATSLTDLTVSLTIAPNAAPGPKDVSVATGNESAVGLSLFRVTAATPQIISINPNSGSSGQSLTVQIEGAATNFTQGATQLSIGTGITTNSVTVASGTSLTANISIQSNVTPGLRDVAVVTGSESATLIGGFRIVEPGAARPLSCSVSAGVPPLLRAEGFTELAGDLLVICTGGTAGQTTTTNLQLFLNAPITSRLTGSQSEALLLVDEPLPGAASVPPSVYRAIPAQTDGSIVWTNVQIVAPGAGQQRVLRIVNVRANATAIGVSTTLAPSPLIAFLSASPSSSLLLSHPQQTVGYVQAGLQFAVTNCNNTALASPAFAQCEPQNATGNARAMQFAVRFTEGFHTAFKTRILPGQTTSLPGAVYSSESGFLRPDLPAAVGGADRGTQLAARFTNIPKGVRLFATMTPSGGSTPGLNATLIGGMNAGTLACNGNPGVPSAEIPVVNGSAVAIWEVTAANAAAIETAVFGIGVAYTFDPENASPGLGQVSAAGSFAPYYAVANTEAGRMSASLPIPRFIDAPQMVEAFRLESCVTHLLFPFVTNAQGFDTGIAIANTSRDPLGAAARLQDGRCTIHYYGQSAPPPTTTSAVAAGGSPLTFVLSSGGSHGVPATPGFQGYLIVRCDFRYAHGFAFVTDGPIGSARVAEGYLALIMDAPAPARGAVSEVLKH